MKKRLIFAAVGFAYAFVYGFWTMFITGGGHGNFLWLMLFFFAYIAGLFFPIAGFVAADLRPLSAKSTVVAILAVNLFLTVIHFTTMGEEGSHDLAASWDRSAAGFMLALVVHAFPVVLLIGLLCRSFLDEASEEAELP
jgi:hypothetical protein